MDNLHQVVIMDDDKVIDQAKSVNVGASLFVHEFLQSEKMKDEKGQLRLTQFIRATELVPASHFTENTFQLDIY